MARLYAGTSGFAYPAWKPEFYPADLPAVRFLEHYAGRLNAVEINYTFRRVPSRAALEAWAGATPPGFRFALKAPMRITHILRLRGAARDTRAFLRALEPLSAARRLGPVLFQLPPNLPRDAGLLEAFLAALPAGFRYAFEFRHESWLDPETYRQLRARRAALCVAESERLEVPEVITAGFVYYRLRKPSYSNRDLAAIARRARQLLAKGKDLYLIFKHEDEPHGPLWAESVLNRFRER